MKAVILALALSCAGAFAPVNKAAVRAPVELEAKKSVADLSEADLKGKKVLIRCDLNVPIKEGVIGDDTRIRASVPTVKYLLDKHDERCGTTTRPTRVEEFHRSTPVEEPTT